MNWKQYIKWVEEHVNLESDIVELHWKLENGQSACILTPKVKDDE